MLTIQGFLLAFFLTSQVQAAPLSFRGYLRSSAGSNLKGGQQECFNNPGSFGNEFRVGNECGMYGEATFASDLTDQIKFPEVSSQAYLTFSYNYQNRTDYELTNQNWVIRQAYVDLGIQQELPGVFWVGKRYYRWGDISALDFYPVQMNGVGAGYGDLRKGPGLWHFAIIQNSEAKEINGTGTAIATENQVAAKTTVHLRLEEVAVGAENTLAFWLTGGSTPATKSIPSPGTDYKAGTGGFLAVKNQWVGVRFQNETALAYGQGVMTGMGSSGELVKDCSDSSLAICTTQSSDRIRFWNAALIENDKWSGQFSFVYDHLNKRTSSDSRVRWISVAAEPVYYITDHIHFISVFGLSNVLDESDGLGTRTLSQITLGPQITVAKGFYSRPVLRALYSARFWNRANEASFAGSSARGRDDAQSLVAQVEVWF